ncbi:MAG: Fpg/Nei family DNA glycosylase [Candidatus Heimdallarchaeota archaeon]|nr:Fpg/Nei family DNA glycosylase [Candidatus Heimdallarchaeota archaeon]
MPELPEVEIFKQYIDSTSLHKKIVNVDLTTPSLLGKITKEQLIEVLKNQKFEKTDRYGKHLLVGLDHELYLWLILHFGMSGNLEYFKESSDKPKYTKLLIEFENGYHLAYINIRKLGEINLSKNITDFIKAKDLGPDVLQISYQKFRAIISSRRGTIKYTLMNQHIMAGIGNVYADEILFQTAINPETKANEIAEKKREELYDNMKKILKKAIEAGAEFGGLPDWFLISHRANNGRCPKCNTKLKQIKVSGRTTYYCPNRQPKKK